MKKKYGWFAHAPYSGDRYGGHLDASLSTAPAFGALSAVAIGGLTLVDPYRLDDRTRVAYRLVDAVVGGAYTSITLPVEFPLTGEQRSAVGVAVGGLTLALADLTEALDARIAGWLRTLGVRRPRWVMAGTAAAAVLAGYAWDRAEKNRMREAVDALLSSPDRLRPVTAEVRELLEVLLLDRVPGADALRRQLDSAQERVQGDGLLPEAWFEVDEAAPRVSPRTQVWPVAGRFHWEGTWYEVQLQILRGRLDVLSLLIADDQDGDEEPDDEVSLKLLDRWPGPREVEIVVEAADPVSRAASRLRGAAVAGLGS